jgi:hypothetical protein
MNKPDTNQSQSTSVSIVATPRQTTGTSEMPVVYPQYPVYQYPMYPQYHQYYEPTPQYIQPTPQYIQPTPQYIQPTPQYTTEQYQCPQYPYYQYPQYQYPSQYIPYGYYCEIQYVAPLIISSKSNSSHSSQPPQDTRECLEVSM